MAYPTPRSSNSTTTDRDSKIPQVNRPGFYYALCGPLRPMTKLNRNRQESTGQNVALSILKNQARTLGHICGGISVPRGGLTVFPVCPLSHNPVIPLAIYFPLYSFYSLYRRKKVLIINGFLGVSVDRFFQSGGQILPVWWTDSSSLVDRFFHFGGQILPEKSRCGQILPKW